MTGLFAGDNSLLARYPELAREWDHKLNFPLTPDQVLYCSGKSIGGGAGSSCGRRASKIVSGKGRDSPWPIPQVLPAPAPVCDSSGARRPVGRLKNALLTPDQVSAQSGRKIWWQCERGMFGRVPSTSGSAGMAAHIAQAIAQARNIVCRPVTLPLPPSGTRREIRG